MQVTGMKDKVDFQYKNSFDAIRTIVRSEGLRGLYTGLSKSKKTSSCPSWATNDDFCSSYSRRQFAQGITLHGYFIRVIVSAQEISTFNLINRAALMCLLFSTYTAKQPRTG